MEYKKMYFEKDHSILKVIFNHPENLNALTPEFVQELNYLLNEIEAAENISLVIFTGTGKAFIAGADIAAMKEMSPEQAIQYSKETTELYKKMEDSKKIFIAAINGYALGGGCEFTLACDIRIASSKAKFGLPEIGLGIFPGGGGTQRLPRMIGMAKAKELIYTGKVIAAEDAYKLGLVNELTEPDMLMNAAECMANDILKNCWNALAYVKESLNSGMQMSLEQGVKLERNLFGLCFATEDQREGMSAFLEKREAKFKNKVGEKK